MKALSAPDDLVVDPYAGSGTTLAVAARLGRRFLGIDASDLAVETAKARLGAMGIALSVAESARERTVLARSR